MPANSTAEKKITESLLLIHYFFHEKKYPFSHNTGIVFHEVPCLIWHQDNTWHFIQKYQNLPHRTGIHKYYISYNYFNKYQVNLIKQHAQAHRNELR